MGGNVPATGSAMPSVVRWISFDTDLGDGHWLDRPPERVGQELMAQAYTEARPSELAHPVRDGRLLLDQPGVFVLLPDVLGSAHHEQHVEGLEVGNGLARIELDGVQSEAGVFEEGTERAGVFVGMVLKDENPSRNCRWLVAARSSVPEGGVTAGCRGIP